MFSRKLPVTLALALSCAAATAGAAQATPSGLERVSADTAKTSTSPKTVTAYCPDGKQVLGGGGEIVGALGEVIVDDLMPLSDLSGYQMTAYEDEPTFNDSWELVVHAICADAMPSLDRVSQSTAHDDLDGKTSYVFCPGAITGLGYELNTAFGNVLVENLEPTVAVGLAQALREDHPYHADWFLEVHSVCADPAELGSVPIAVRAKSANDHRDGKSITAECPDGMMVVGAAGSNNGEGEVVMDDIRPEPDLRSVTVEGWETDTFYDPWYIQATAICA
jgi:hypothetical protein